MYELKKLKIEKTKCKDGIKECIKNNNLIDGTFRSYVNRLDVIKEKIDIIKSNSI